LRENINKLIFHFKQCSLLKNFPLSHKCFVCAKVFAAPMFGLFHSLIVHSVLMMIELDMTCIISLWLYAFFTLSLSLSLSLSNYNPVFVEHLSVAFDSLFFQPDLSTFLSFGTNLQPPFKTPFQNCMPCVCENVSVTKLSKLKTNLLLLTLISFSRYVLF
jgi:hypothetical protein